MAVCPSVRLRFTMQETRFALPPKPPPPQVIRLSDCIRVTEVVMDGCPRDTGPFLVETTEKTFMFAADREQLDDWTQKLCEIAFPVSARLQMWECFPWFGLPVTQLKHVAASVDQRSLCYRASL